MRGYLERRLEHLIPAILVLPPGLPEPEPGEVSGFVSDFMAAGTPAFRLLYRIAVLTLQAFCLLIRHRSLYSLSPEEAREFLESLYSSRNPALGALSLLVSMPVYMAYYGGDEVQEALGFPVLELRREARERGVRR